MDLTLSNHCPNDLVSEPSLDSTVYDFDKAALKLGFFFN